MLDEVRLQEMVDQKAGDKVVVSTKVTPVEALRLKSLAKERAISPSGYLRGLLQEAIRKQISGRTS